jgi:hypothetical protein
MQTVYFQAISLKDCLSGLLDPSGFCPQIIRPGVRRYSCFVTATADLRLLASTALTPADMSDALVMSWPGWNESASRVPQYKTPNGIC